MVDDDVVAAPRGVDRSKVTIIKSLAFFFESFESFFRGNYRIIIKKVTKAFKLNLGRWEFKAVSEDG